ncbi:MAG: rhodanese-like domain-containing protein [Burkholderiales bacterium]|nr:rhodanese-like domain-containing protein [Burkholderiales bacterium]
MSVDPWKFAQDNFFLIAIALVSGFMLLWPVIRRGTGGPVVDTLQATQMLNREDAVFVDIREPAEYEKGHILHARNLPLKQLEEKARELEKYKNRPLIVHCDTGSRSGAAASLLRRKGFERVYSLSGGLAAWRQAGLPVEK